VAQFTVQGLRSRYLDVPPDVTTGRVVVAVGGIVVVVGWIVVVGGGAVVPPDPAAPPALPAAVVVGVGTEAGVGPFGPPDDPGCSLATVTPMKALTPPATTIVVLVSRLTRACARARALGEYRSGVRLTASQGGSAPASAHGG